MDNQVPVHKNRGRVRHIWIPRTGGHSIKQVLSHRLKNVRAHDFDEGENVFKFIFVRHPLERLVSLYGYEHYRGEYKSFEDMCEDVFAGKESAKQCNMFGRNQMDWMPKDIGFVGRVEQFAKDFVRLCEIIGEEVNDIPKVASWKHFHTKPYRDYYTPTLLKRALEHYKPDMTKLGYTWET